MRSNELENDLHEMQTFAVLKENDELRRKNLLLEKNLHEMIFRQERMSTSHEAQLQAYKRQQHQIAKILKKTLCKLHDTSSHLSKVQEDLTCYQLHEHELVQTVFNLKTELRLAKQTIEILEDQLWMTTQNH